MDSTSSFTPPLAASHFVPDPDYQIPGVAAGANPALKPADTGMLKPGPEVLKVFDYSDTALKKADTPVPDAPAAMPAEQVKEEETHCKHCRRNLKFMLGLPKPTEDEKRAWRRHVLGEPRFVKTYSMLGGAVMITLRNRQMGETEMLYAQLTKDVDAGILPPGAVGSTMHFLRQNQLLAALSLCKLELLADPEKPKVYLFPEVTADAYPSQTGSDAQTPLGRAYDAVQKAMPNEAVASMVMACSCNFEQLVTELTERADDADFWPAVDGTN